MAAKLFSDEQRNWIKNNWNSCPIMGLYILFNEKFKTNMTSKQISNQAYYLGYKSDLLWNEEEDIWFKENYSLLGPEETAKAFNKKFHRRPRSVSSIKQHANKLGLYVNKDYKHDVMGKARRVPIGTIVTDNGGYLRIKTGKGRTGWELLYRYIWESNNGPIPKGYRVFLLDGNRKNNRLDNMILVSNKVHSMMNINQWNKSDRVIAMSGLAWCRLREAILERNNNANNT